MASPVAWLEAKPLGVQLLVLAAVFDPAGLVLGYALGRRFLGVDPIAGAGYGLVAASIPLVAWILRADGDDRRA